MSEDRSYNGRKPRPFQTKEDMVAHLRDARYRGDLNQRDTAYIEYCEACSVLTPDEVLGIGTDLNNAMGAESRQDWQDPQGDLDKDTSVYHSIEEQQADARNPKYKTDAYFREQVARKIGRSTPDWEPRSGKQYASLQCVGDGEQGPGYGTEEQQG